MDRVAVAFENLNNRRRIAEVLESEGMASCLQCRSADQVKRLAYKQRLGAVICGFKLPDESAGELFYDLPDRCALLVVARQSQLEMLPSDDILRLPAPFSRRELLTAVEFMLHSYQRTQPGIRPHRDPESAALVEEAKDLLMDRLGMTEAQVHRALQQRSMDTGRKMEELARCILEQEERAWLEERTGGVL